LTAEEGVFKAIRFISCRLNSEISTFFLFFIQPQLDLGLFCFILFGCVLFDPIAACISSDFFRLARVKAPTKQKKPALEYIK